MTGKFKKILEEIHPLHIIREVQKWPALYARDCPERASPHYRRKIWCEIGKALFADWATYSKMERLNKNLTKKWRNLRDTFKRQLEVEKKIKEGNKIKKKIYVYYNHMSFLLPHVQSDNEQEERSGAAPSLGAAPVMARLPRTDHIDEDRHFLMSLIPSFRRMSDDEKLTAKVEILQVIKKIRNSNPCREVGTLAYDVDEDVAGDIDVNVKQEMLDIDEAEIDLDLEPEDTADSGRDDDDTE